MPALEGDQRQILEAVVASYPAGWSPHSGNGSALIVTLTRLEMKKLVERGPGGYRATKLGRRVIEEGPDRQATA
jgi:hypothetical protein